MVNIYDKWTHISQRQLHILTSTSQDRGALPQIIIMRIARTAFLACVNTLQLVKYKVNTRSEMAVSGTCRTIVIRTRGRKQNIVIFHNRDWYVT